MKRLYIILLLIPVFLIGCTKRESTVPLGKVSYDDKTELTLIELNLRVHIMCDIIIPHPTGIDLDRWVSTDDVINIIVPEMNAIWDQAKIKWVIESIIEEDVVKDSNYAYSISYIANCIRDEDGHADPARLPLLYSLMQPENRSTANELGTNLFHLYIFPFVGNTSQGNAMSGFDYHSIVGSWSNKHNGGGIPEKTLLTEYHNAFDRGSLSRTASHELGHVLNLRHDECPYDCLMSGGSNGYSLTKAQIAESRAEAFRRSIN